MIVNAQCRVIKLACSFHILRRGRYAHRSGTKRFRRGKGQANHEYQHAMTEETKLEKISLPKFYSNLRLFTGTRILGEPAVRSLFCANRAPR